MIIYQQLIDLALELRTQDNASTSHPLFLVQQRHRISGLDPQFDHLDYEWHSEDHEYRYSPGEIQEVIVEEIAGEQHCGVEEVEPMGHDPELHGWEKVYYIDRWEFVCAHFTRKAAQRYIDENNHRLKDPRIYVSSQYRCHEWNDAVVWGAGRRDGGC